VLSTRVAVQVRTVEAVLVGRRDKLMAASTGDMAHIGVELPYKTGKVVVHEVSQQQVA
jgi:hypothetical protein